MAVPIASQFDEIFRLSLLVHDGLLEINIILEMAIDQHSVKVDQLLFLLDKRVVQAHLQADTLHSLIRVVKLS
jgi:hypothetical protein